VCLFFGVRVPVVRARSLKLRSSVHP